MNTNGLRPVHLGRFDVRRSVSLAFSVGGHLTRLSVECPSDPQSLQNTALCRGLTSRRPLHNPV